jgi:hypothetical protein
MPLPGPPWWGMQVIAVTQARAIDCYRRSEQLLDYPADDAM